MAIAVSRSFINSLPRSRDAALYTGIVASMAAVFLSDVLTPLGYAVWILYLVPIMVSLAAWRPYVPLATAALSTVLIVVGYYLSPPGILQSYAVTNRAIGATTVWVVAIIVHQAIRNKVQLRVQEWLQAGRTGLSERIGGDQPLHQLGENITRYLAQYLDAEAGVLYVEQEGVFRRAGQFALANVPGVPDSFTPGQGLPGQAAIEQRLLSLSAVPEDYYRIQSVLGRARPRHLLICPMAVDKQVNAVVEFAFLRPISGEKPELLNRVAESIALAVRSAKDRARLQALLEETQRQAEELQAQSEELRVSNEELEEQSRALKESQTRLELQQQELEQTNLHLEEQARTLEAQKQGLAQAKAELEGQAAELERVSQYKSDFLANMSHELRTPLNSSLILAKLLADNKEGNLTPEQVKYAQTIQSAGNDLLSLITEILDLSKIEAGHMEVHTQNVHLPGLLEALRRMFQPLAQDKHLALKFATTPGAPDKIQTDPQRLEQILKNLLSNAIKFTEHGEVSLELTQPDSHRVSFIIKDTGIGIPAHQQQVIFEPFRQADGTTNRRYGGTGLGLSISRELVRLLGGELTLSSAEGQGSTFTVTLPLQPPSVISPAPRVIVSPRRAPAVPPPSPLPKTPALGNTAQPKPAQVQETHDDRSSLNAGEKVILVVEDDLAFARILCDLAHEMQFKCVMANSAQEGVILAQQYRPAAVLLDIGLPDNTGLSVLERLKSDPRTRHVPVHVVSCHDYAQTAYSMGAIGYMLKPVSREKLVKALEQLDARLVNRLRRVLVVEDDPVQLESVQKLLKSKDVETVGVRTAAECLEMLKTTTVDCMVLDLSLPDASGFALLEALSAQDRYSFPPVIVYTGRELGQEEEQRLRKYSQSIILKGAKSPERLLDEVTLFLHQVVSELPAEQQLMLRKARSRDAALEGRTILIAEDDVRNVFALTSILEPHGAKVLIARNGREALEALRRAEEQDTPVDLALMDIMMPEMDGLTAMKEIRLQAKWKKLPIIALTAKAMKSDQEQCLAAGANDYMPKPIDVEKLLSLVRVWMPR